MGAGELQKRLNIQVTLQIVFGLRSPGGQLVYQVMLVFGKCTAVQSWLSISILCDGIRVSTRQHELCYSYLCNPNYNPHFELLVFNNYLRKNTCLPIDFIKSKKGLRRHHTQRLIKYALIQMNALIGQNLSKKLIKYTHH